MTFTLLCEMTSAMLFAGSRSNFCALSCPSAALNKVCCRCGAEYKINTKGSCVRKEECSFHWGRLRKHKGYIVINFCWNQYETWASLGVLAVLFLSSNINHQIHPALLHSLQLSFPTISPPPSPPSPPPPPPVSACLLLTVVGGWETSYSCCAAGVGTPGCQVSKVSLLNGSC